MKAANTWTLANVGRTELINLFSGRSFWHSHVSGAFGDIQNHKAMVQWLEVEDDEGPSDLEVWHLQKPHYTFKDLEIWKKEGTLNKTIRRSYNRRKRQKLDRRKEKRRIEIQMIVWMRLRPQRKEGKCLVEKVKSLFQSHLGPRLKSRLSEIGCICI